MGEYFFFGEVFFFCFCGIVLVSFVGEGFEVGYGGRYEFGVFEVFGGGGVDGGGDDGDGGGLVGGGEGCYCFVVVLWCFW